MESAAVDHFVFLEPTPSVVLRIWRAWFRRFALLGGLPVAFACLINYYSSHLSKPPALIELAMLPSQVGVIAPFWAYIYTFRSLFEKSLDGVRIRLQPLSPAGSAQPPQTFLTPTKLLIRKVRKKWTQRSWRWGVGSLIAMLVFGFYKADDWLKQPHALSGPNSAESFIALFLFVVLFIGTPLGWLVGTALELKSIFKGDFGEFGVCLTRETDPDNKS